MYNKSLAEECCNLILKVRKLTEEYEWQEDKIADLSAENVNLLGQIKLLTEENERLSDERDRYKRYYLNHCFDELRANVEADVRAEIDTLKTRVVEETHLRHQAEEMLANGMSVVKTDTVRKMQERLLEELYKIAKVRHGDEPNMKSPEVFRMIDRIAKEILEETQPIGGD